MQSNARETQKSNNPNFSVNDLHEVIITEFDKQSQRSICLTNLKQHEVLRILLCDHYYHKNCIDEWLNKNNVCPNCRKSNV